MGRKLIFVFSCAIFLFFFQTLSAEENRLPKAQTETILENVRTYFFGEISKVEAFTQKEAEIYISEKISEINKKIETGELSSDEKLLTSRLETYRTMDGEALAREFRKIINSTQTLDINLAGAIIGGIAGGVGGFFIGGWSILKIPVMDPRWGLACFAIGVVVVGAVGAIAGGSL